MWVRMDTLTECPNVPEQHKVRFPLGKRKGEEKNLVLGKGILKIEKLGKHLNI